jgi:hypothetical protein
MAKWLEISTTEMQAIIRIPDPTKRATLDMERLVVGLEPEYLHRFSKRESN